MNSQQKFEYWLNIAKDDLKAAKAMYKNRLWLHTAFMCQQSIEKLSKGLYTILINDNVPLIHDLNKLITLFINELTISLSKEQELFLDNLSLYYIKARYPDFKQTLTKQLCEYNTQDILTTTEEIFACLLASQK